MIASGQLVREQERRRLERDLHDGVKSAARGLIFLSSAATRVIDTDPSQARGYLHDIRQATWDILADVNIILTSMSSDGYTGQALHQLIELELRRLIGQDQSRVSVDLGEDLPVLPMHYTRELLFLIREAVVNALEHAEAQEIRVALHRHGNDQLRLVIEDDGRGFEPTVVASGHLGVMSMRERAEEIGGACSIARRNGGGTTVSIRLPLVEDGTEGGNGTN